MLLRTLSKKCSKNVAISLLITVVGLVGLVCPVISHQCQGPRCLSLYYYYLYLFFTYVFKIHEPVLYIKFTYLLILSFITLIL